MKVIYLLIGGAILFALLVLMAGLSIHWIAARRQKTPNLAEAGKLVIGTPAEIDDVIKQRSGNGKRLSVREIDAILGQIPSSGWNGARGADMVLSGQDSALVRDRALHALRTLKPLPISDYWTLPCLIELVGHPIPEAEGKLVVTHFRRMDEVQQKDREMMLESLVRVGTEAAAQAIIEAAEREASILKNRVEYPLEAAADLNRLEPGFKKLLSEYFERRVELDPKGLIESADFKLWLIVDRDHAAERLSRPKIWDINRDSLRSVLTAFKARSAIVPEQRLMSLDSTLLQQGTPDWQTTSMHGYIVWLLARAGSTNADRLIVELAKEPATAELAYSAKAALLGVVNPDREAETMASLKGFAACPPPVRHYLAVRELGMEISNGGMDQYFFNSSGDNWEDALDGLEAMGFKKTAIAFKKAIGVFQPNPPSTNRTVRWKQLEAFTEKQKIYVEKCADEMEQGYEEGATLPYIMQHAEYFRESAGHSVRKSASP